MNETSSTLKIIEVSNKRWIYWGEYNLVFQYSQPLMNVLRSYETGISRYKRRVTKSIRKCGNGKK